MNWIQRMAGRWIEYLDSKLLGNYGELLVTNDSSSLFELALKTGTADTGTASTIKFVVDRIDVGALFSNGTNVTVGESLAGDGQLEIPSAGDWDADGTVENGGGAWRGINTPMAVANVIGPASGGSADYNYSAYGFDESIAIDDSGTGSYGLTLAKPAAQTNYIMVEATAIGNSAVHCTFEIAATDTIYVNTWNPDGTANDSTNFSVKVYYP